MKKCPFCAEELQNEAVICRFCKFDLKTGRPIETRENSEVKAKSSINDGVRLGIGMFIKLPLIIIGIILAVCILLGLIGSLLVPYQVNMKERVKQQIRDNSSF